ncbi:hypothetical protein Tco_0523871 [Tanacetum coccineum]
MKKRTHVQQSEVHRKRQWLSASQESTSICSCKDTLSSEESTSVSNCSNSMPVTINNNQVATQELESDPTVLEFV